MWLERTRVFLFTLFSFLFFLFSGKTLSKRSCVLHYTTCCSSSSSNVLTENRCRNIRIQPCPRPTSVDFTYNNIYDMFVVRSPPLFPRRGQEFIITNNYAHCRSNARVCCNLPRTEKSAREFITILRIG